jgi:hypothetical protein
MNRLGADGTLFVLFVIAIIDILLVVALLAFLPRRTLSTATML